MRISRRISGGRGEYELSGEAANGLRAIDLLDRRIVLDFGDGWRVDTDTQVVHQGGKPRFRRFHRTVDHIQVHRQVAAALLMPHPIREDSNLARGLPILRENGYVIDHIELNNEVDLGDHRAFLGIREIVLRNMSNHAEDLHFVDRTRRLREVWAHSDQLPAPISTLLAQHQAQVQNGGPVMSTAERVVSELQTQVTELAEDLGVLYRSADSDVLEDIEQALSLSATPPEPPILVNQVDPDETMVRRRILKDWKRWANARGAASAVFRQAVRRAYNSTCIVCGIHLPQTAVNTNPGVDAAHILPWANYDLDVVSNGVCLCKLHHWAFDEGLIVIREDAGTYFVEVPANVVSVVEAEQPAFSVGHLLGLAGPIPQQRLPRARRDRPSPVFLRLLAEAQ